MCNPPSIKRASLFTIDKLMSGSSLVDKEATKLGTQRLSTAGKFAPQNPDLYLKHSTSGLVAK